MLTLAISMISPEIKKYKYRFHFGTQFLIPLKFLEFLKIVLINMVTIWMMSVKIETLGLLKIKVL